MSDHDERKAPLADLSHTARRVTELGRETAAKTSEYVRGGLDRAAEYAEDLTDRASDRISDFTGRPLDVWARELRQFVEHSPIKALVIAVVSGYLLGRAVRRS